MNKKIKGEVIFGGVGGQGVLLIGEILSQAANMFYENVVFFPNYSAAVRGGTCECTVIFADEKIASPVLSKAQVVVILDPSQLKTFEERVRTGGTVIVESTGLCDKVGRRDITVIEVQALKVARAMGNPVVSNFILLGAYIKLTNLVSPQLVEKELETRFGDKVEALSLNIEAFHQGLK